MIEAGLSKPRDKLLSANKEEDGLFHQQLQQVVIDRSNQIRT